MHPEKTAITIIRNNVEIRASNICFTGDAIASLSTHPAKSAAVVNLDEWDWYEELREGTSFYIITNLKKPIF